MRFSILLSILGIFFLTNCNDASQSGRSAAGGGSGNANPTSQPPVVNTATGGEPLNTGGNVAGGTATAGDTTGGTATGGTSTGGTATGGTSTGGTATGGTSTGGTATGGITGGEGTLIDVTVTFQSLGTLDAVLKNCVRVSINGNPNIELGCNKGEAGGLRKTTIKLRPRPLANNLKFEITSNGVLSISPDSNTVFAAACSYLSRRKGLAFQYDSVALRACVNDNNDTDYQDFNFRLDGLNSVNFDIQGTTLRNY